MDVPASLLCISLIGPGYAELRQQIAQAMPLADLVELRLDLLPQLSLEEIRQIKHDFSIPMIFTCRSTAHGGSFKGSEDQRMAFLYSLLSLNPDYMDLEADISPDIIRQFQSLSPATKWILSWHDCHSTPQDLESLLARLLALPADIYKIATHAQSICDALRVLHLAQQTNRERPRLAAMCMGELGHCTRILSPLVKCPLTFASLNQQLKAAPGQLDAHTLLQTYHFRHLSHRTALYGLIGYPIEQSRSQFTHNAVFRQLGLDAVYVKFSVTPVELQPFLQAIRHFNVRGLSVTMPHKETVRSFLTHPDPIGACNTIFVEQERLIGFNTDGIGALKALKIPNYANQRLLLIGAGGTARAIAHEASRQGAHVHILNRHPAKAKQLAQEVKGTASELSDFQNVIKQGYHIVVQATSVGMASRERLPLDFSCLQPNMQVLDVISYPKETSFISQARRCGCTVHTGLDMFIHQAVAQFKCWLGEQVDSAKIETTMRECLEEQPRDYALVYKSHLKGQVKVPSSKSHSIRAILLGAMANGRSSIKGVLPSPDIEKAIQAAQLLGATVQETGDEVEIFGVGGQPCTPNQVLDVGNSGQVLRFAGALATLSSGYTVLTGDASIRSNRVVQPLLDGLQGLGAFAKSTRQNGYAPIIVQGPLKAGKTALSGEDSQPVSALLMAAAFIEGKTEIHVRKPGELPWIALTLSWLDRLGVRYQHENFEKFTVIGQRVRPSFTFTIPGDWSSAAFPIAAALITESEIMIDNLDIHDVQGDKAIIAVLQQMGASLVIDQQNRTIQVKRSTKLKGQTIDLNSMIDAVTILAVLGCFAEGETRLINGAIARHKECNRLACIAAQLQKMGGQVFETEDGLIIHPSRLKGAVVDSYGDHRMALSLMIAGMGAEGETCVRGIECIEKSYPSFIRDMQSLGACVKCL